MEIWLADLTHDQQVTDAGDLYLPAGGWCRDPDGGQHER